MQPKQQSVAPSSTTGNVKQTNTKELRVDEPRPIVSPRGNFKHEHNNATTLTTTEAITMGDRDVIPSHHEFTTTYESTVTADQNGHHESNINPADNLAHRRKRNVGKFQLSNGG